MPESLARATFRQRLCMAAAQDERIVGLLVLGSGSDERLDEWSDIDSLFFLKDADFELFVHEWRGWATQFGEMVLVYEPVGFPSTFWTIYHAEPFPLRVEYILRPESQLATILSLTASPRSVEAMVCCDKTGGHIKSSVEHLVGRSLRLPASEEQPTFQDRCDTLWYGLLYAYNKLQRGQQWYARMAFHISVLDSLMALLKLEANAVGRWQASFPSWNLEHLIPPTRLTQLNACIPLEGADNLKQAMVRAAVLGREVCETVAQQHQWSWQQIAAEEILRTLTI